jgi:hypothetical protein
MLHCTSFLLRCSPIPDFTHVGGRPYGIQDTLSQHEPFVTSVSVSIRFGKGEGSNQSLHSLLGRHRPVRLSIFQRTRYPKAAFWPDMFSFSLSGHLQSFGRHTQRGFGFPVNNRCHSVTSITWTHWVLTVVTVTHRLRNRAYLRP